MSGNYAIIKRQAKEDTYMNIYKVIGWTDWDGDDYPVNKGSVATDLAVIECIRKNGYAFGGDSHQNRKGCCPVLNDGTKVRYSMRGWGSIMASALDIDDSDGYAYMEWYMVHSFIRSV